MKNLFCSPKAKPLNNYLFRKWSTAFSICDGLEKFFQISKIGFNFEYRNCLRTLFQLSPWIMNLNKSIFSKMIIKKIYFVFLTIVLIALSCKKEVIGNNTTNNTWTTYTSANTNRGLSAPIGGNQNGINSIIIDSVTNIWIGLQAGGGVTKFDGTNWWNYTSSMFHYNGSFISWNSGFGLNNDYINYITNDKHGRKWFATLQGVSEFDTIWRHIWMNYPLDPNPVVPNGAGYIKNHIYTFDNFTSTIAIDKSDNVWIGTRNGVWMIDSINYKSLYTLPGATFVNGKIKIITIDYFIMDNNVIKFNTSNGLVNDTVTAIKSDSKGNIWIGTQNGISEFSNAKMTNFTTADGLANNWILSIAIDAQDNAWIGTYGGGVSEYDGVKWTTYTTANGLANNYVSSIAFDTQGNKWFGTYKGVSKFDGMHWTTYTTKDGLANNIVNAIAIDSYGNKWFGTNDGLSKFQGK
jgi:ligand-binding sensor domain-containing protein